MSVGDNGSEASCPVKKPVDKLRFLKTGLIFAAYISVGWSQALLGPTLMDFRILVNVGLHEISLLIPAAFGGYALGNVLVSLVEGRINLQIILILCLIVAAISNALAVWMHGLIYLCGCLFLNGIAGGLIESASISYILHLWGNESTAFLQMVDFLYGVGSIIGPAIAKPFLVDENKSDGNGTIIGVSRDDLMISFPYSINAVYCSLIAGMFMVAYLIKNIDEPHPSRGEEAIASNAATVNPIAKISVIILVALLYLFSNGMAMVLETFVTSYVVKSEHGASKGVGALMVTVSWVVHTCLGVPSIFLMKAIGLKWNLTIQVALIVASGVVFLLLGHVSLCWLWLAVILESVGNCSVFGSLMGYLEQFFPVTGRMTSLFLLSICVGDTIWPMLVGYYIEAYPEVFSYTMIGCALTVLCLFVLLVFIAKTRLIKIDSFKSGDDKSSIGEDQKSSSGEDDEKRSHSRIGCSSGYGSEFTLATPSRKGSDDGYATHHYESNGDLKNRSDIFEPEGDVEFAIGKKPVIVSTEL